MLKTALKPALSYTSAMERLVSVVQELSMAHKLDDIARIVRCAARDLTGADGATFVLREDDCCYYYDENAIAPLWKGKKFSMNCCISGWVMIHREHAAIKNIYKDERIPIDVYRPTFVHSLLMVPIRKTSPIGAIGNYWAKEHRITKEEIKLLQALADTTSVAMENIRVYSELEQRVAERTAELEFFSYAVSHDLRAPLRGVRSYSQLLASDHADHLSQAGKMLLARIHNSAERMDHLIEDLLALSRASKAPLVCEPVNLTHIATEIVEELRAANPQRLVEFVIGDNLTANADPHLIRVALENLLSNAWKFTTHTPKARVEFGCSDKQECRIYFVRDNGAGFEMEYADKLFTPFQRLHAEEEFPGNGVGLAIVQKVIKKHGGRIWPEAQPGVGATFYFTLDGAK